MTTSKTVAISQSNYIPWKGFFDFINSVDEFVLYDEVQYTRRDWRNRNKIKTRDGLRWLTIPVQVKGNYHQRIDEMTVSDPDWARRHWDTITHNYAKAACFSEMRSPIGDLYNSLDEPSLSHINLRFLTLLCNLLGIRTHFTWSTEYPRAADDRVERLVEICQQLNATDYVTGPSARDYLDESAFHTAGIRVHYMDYRGYPEYPQLFGTFEHGVSVLDLIFNTGREAPCFMKSF